MKSNDYVKDFLKSEDSQLQKLHNIVEQAIIDEKALTTQLDIDVDDERTIGEKIADAVADFGGSWRFIILFGIIILCWIVYNSFIFLNKSFDPYPYILLNLILSCIAALQAPVIMMSQNRQETRDRKRAENDYMINLKSELEIRNLHQKIDVSTEDQYKHLCEIQQKQIELLQQILLKLNISPKN